MKVRAIGALGTLALLVPSLAHADPGPQPPELVPETAAGSSPEASPGTYRVTLPADTTERSLRLSRRTGETLAAVAYGRVDRSNDADSINLEITTPDGSTSCDTDSATGTDSTDAAPLVVLPAAKRAPTSTPTPPDCVGATDVVLTLSRGNSGDAGSVSNKNLDIELTITKEPAIEGASDRAVTAADLRPQPPAIKNDENLAPGTTPATAAPLADGAGTKVKITPGTTAFYKVRLGWGQRLDVSAQAPEKAAGYAPEVDLRADLGIRAPNGISVLAGGDNYQTVYKDPTFETSNLSAFSAPVRFANRAFTGTESEPVQWTTQPGWYVVSLRVGPTYDGKLPANPRPVPALLTVKVSGDAERGPTFRTADGQPAAAPSPGALSGPGKDSSVIGTIVKVGVTALALAAIVAAVVWARRGRRS